MTSTVEPWLRGPVDGVPAPLQPVAHALLMAREDVLAATSDLTPDEWHLRPAGVASVAYHVRHLAGSTRRLFTYAAGEGLDEVQRTALRHEATVDAERPDPESLRADWSAAVDAGLERLRRTDPDSLADARGVGRASLPSTVLGLLFHAAEHAARHTGQIVTTAKLVRGRVE